MAFRELKERSRREFETDNRLQKVLGCFREDFKGDLSLETLGPKFGEYGSFLPCELRVPNDAVPRDNKTQNLNGKPPRPTKPCASNGPTLMTRNPPYSARPQNDGKNYSSEKPARPTGSYPIKKNPLYSSDTPKWLVNPSHKPVKPSNKPINSSVQTVKPSNKPMTSALKTVKTSDKPIESSLKPVNPSDKAAKPSDPEEPSEKRNVARSKNVELYKMLGLEESPSHSESSEEQCDLEAEMILKKMTSLPLSGKKILSPLNSKIVDFSRKTTISSSNKMKPCSRPAEKKADPSKKVNTTRFNSAKPVPAPVQKDKNQERDNSKGKRAADEEEENATQTAAPEKGTEDRMATTADNWAQCDRCKQWRMLPYWINPDDLPNEWLCSMIDWLGSGLNSCEVSEDETTKALNALYNVNAQAPEPKINAEPNATNQDNNRPNEDDRKLKKKRALDPQEDHSRPSKKQVKRYPEPVKRDPQPIMPQPAKNLVDSKPCLPSKRLNKREIVEDDSSTKRQKVKEESNSFQNPLRQNPSRQSPSRHNPPRQTTRQNPSRLNPSRQNRQ